MIPISITPNLELSPWTDLADAAPGIGTVERIGLLPNGTTSGRPVVGIVVRAADGQRHIVQTTWALFRTAARGLDASPVAELDRMEHP